MKSKLNTYLLSLLLMVIATFPLRAHQWVRVNQLGYLPQSTKVAVWMSEADSALTSFSLFDAYTHREVKRFTSLKATASIGQMQRTYRLNFSDFTTPGTYYLRAGEAVSPLFPINARVYHGTADFLLHYMRQQRCGFNPYLRDSCHQHDAYIVYHPTRTGQSLDVRGGWHDAADYLQYTTTSANAIYQMMFAYQQNPQSFGDAYQANGLAGANGIPDIVDEIKWGLDWLNRMNPHPGELYNQIADDRDHASLRFPNKDQVDYGYGPGKGRPVYYCSGEKQVRGKYQNATTGVASTAGKFASCFALGACVLKPYYPQLADEIGAKADAAYQAGVRKPGVCQTASVVSPYIYEEDNWVDDMELGAMELYRATGNPTYLQQAVEYGRREPITPWMGADSARHYQWYPFLNMGHFRIAQTQDGRLRQEFIRNLRTGIARTYEKAVQSPFLHGIPYIWCSNNLTVAMLTQCRLYRELTGDMQYQEMETALLDWLLGCNPWGSSMIVELPLSGDYPLQPHSAYILQKHGNATGGLVDGPVYSSIFGNLLGVNLKGVNGRPAQDYARFQPCEMVYHDAMGDYSTNEPTMDGTASLTYYFSALQADGMRQAVLSADNNVYRQGGIVRTNPEKKQLTLVFTAADKADGADVILSTLKKHRIEGAFFLTGDFFVRFPEVVRRLVGEGHYVGSHSYGHLLYMPWEDADSLLITQDEFNRDMFRSYEQLRQFGVTPDKAPLYMPPYEYYNDHIAQWARGLGIQLVNYTPGTLSNADYTTPDMGVRYRSSDTIYQRIMEVEAKEGLNGHLLLIHLGTDPRRTDKFYNKHLDKLIHTLKRRGYSFVPIREATGI